jgi:kumamolisin
MQEIQSPKIDTLFFRYVKSLSNFSPADIINYFKRQAPGFNSPPDVVAVPLTIGSRHYGNDPSNPTLELTQDILASSTIAQGCTINVYFSDITEQGWAIFLYRVMFPEGKE